MKELHKYFPRLSETALQEFIEWCVLEQAKIAGLNFNPDQTKLRNLSGEEYFKQLIDQFMQVKPDPIKAGLVAAVAGKQADNHALSGLAVVADFVSLYVKYLVPKDGTNPEKVDEILAIASKQQYDKLTEIAKKHGVDL